MSADVDTESTTLKHSKRKASVPMPAVARLDEPEQGKRSFEDESITGVAFLSRKQMRAAKRDRGISSTSSAEDLTASLSNQSTDDAVSKKGNKNKSVILTPLAGSPTSLSEGIASSTCATPAAESSTLASSRPAGKPERKRNGRKESDGASSASAAAPPSDAAPAAPFDLEAINPSMLTEELKMVLCVRKDLKMGVGKMCAQCAHAAVASTTYCTLKTKDTRVKQWYVLWDDYCGSKKVAVGIPDLSAMEAIVKQCRALGIPNAAIQDAGRTQVEAGTYTVVAVGPAPNSLVDQVTGAYKLL